MGRLEKYDPEVKVEIIPRNQHTNTTTPPPIGHSLSTIYDSYGNDCSFGKMPSSPENDLNIYNLSMQVWYLAICSVSLNWTFRQCAHSVNFGLVNESLKQITAECGRAFFGFCFYLPLMRVCVCPLCFVLFVNSIRRTRPPIQKSKKITSA